MKNLTKRERVDVSKAFIAAKDSLRGGAVEDRDSSQYICYALEFQQMKGSFSKDTCFNAIQIVSSRLGDNCSLDGWLVANGVPFKAITRQALQKHRYAWLDKLAEEFSH